MRLADSMHAYGVWVDEHSIYGGGRDAQTRQKYNELTSDVCAAINFDIQSVVDLLLDDAVSGWWGSSFAPPFERMVLDYAMGGYTAQVGILARVRDVAADFSDVEHRRACARHWWRSVTNGASWAGESTVPIDDARWLVTLHMFTRSEKEQSFRAPIGRACFALDGNGRPVSDGREGFMLDLWVSQLILQHCYLTDPSGDEEADNQGKLAIAWQALEMDLIHPFLATMALLNTKNIETREVLPSRQQRRDAERRKVDPPATYRVLTVRVPGLDRHKTGKQGLASLANSPLHIVRGHIARYGQEHGKGKLFGKYEGQFWIPAHVRGSAEAGSIVKDYAVNAPREAA